jgi:type IV secretory pathway VirB2 component (pilin)
MERTLQVYLGKSPGTGANSRPFNRHALFPCCRSQRGLPLNGLFLKIEADKENPNMKRFLRKYLRATSVRLPLLIVGFTLLLAIPAFAQTGTSPWENAVSVLQTAFTSTIARGLSLVAIVVAGLTFAFGEGGSKRVLAGVLFGVGMAIAAVNFLAWLFPGA